MAVATKPRPSTLPRKVTTPRIGDAVTEVYLITKTGLYELGGKVAFDLAERIGQDKNHSLLEYRYYDDDKHTWAYWVVADENEISPIIFPDFQQYSTTSPQLYTKAVVFPQVIARIVRKLKETPPSLWDKMLKPTTIILAIVGIIFVMMLGLVALAG